MQRTTSDKATSAPERVQVDHDGLQYVDKSPPEHLPRAMYAAPDPWDSQAAPPAEKDGEREQRIGGLRPWVFWLVVLGIGLIVIGAAVGGAVGGTQSSKNSQVHTVTVSSTPSASATSSPSQVSTTSAAQATATSYDASSIDTTCNNSTFFEPPGNAGGGGAYTFQYNCGYDVRDAENLMEGWVSSLEFCADMCSSWNQLYDVPNGDMPLCKVAIFLLPEYSQPPGNCFLASGGDLYLRKGRDAAALYSS